MTSHLLPLTSYSKHNEYTRFDYNRDNEPLEQINLAMLFGQKSCLPAYYRRLPGNIGDVVLQLNLHGRKGLQNARGRN